ncbi:MAG: hypothetical protein QG577_628, partial [Thermodesulfobacteriota bacterium]|nr:hypothetical protein [Thermodesulfobacteriota bacterium]
IDSASPAEVTLAEKTLEKIRVHDGRKGPPKTRPERLIADKGYDSDPRFYEVMGRVCWRIKF